MFEFDFWNFISTAIAILSLIISIILTVNAKKRESYFTIDNQYKELLDLGLQYPKLRNPIISANYHKLKDSDPDTFNQYQSYAYMIWNFLESIYDFASSSKKSSLFNTWGPVLYEENKIHFKWFLDHKYLFKDSFQKFVLEYLNELEINEGNGNDFKYVYKALLEEFPLEELKDKDQMLHLLITRKYKLYLLRFKHRIIGDNSMIGYAIGYTNPSNTMMFLDYINIIPTYQNCGYGSKFLKILQNHLDKKEGKCIIFEIEPADDGATGIKTKRKNFYLRNGASKLDVNYLLPTKDGHISLDLMCLPCESVNFINKETIQGFVKEAVSTIHSDYLHVNQVVEKYIDNIPDYNRLDSDLLSLHRGNIKDVDTIISMIELDFSKHYHVPKQHLKNLLSKKNYHLYLAKTPIGEIVGYAFIYILENKDFIFLDYLSISKFYQNQGYGKMIIQMLKTKFPDIKYGFISETPFPEKGQVDYYQKFVTKSGGYFLEGKYYYLTSRNEKLAMRLTIYPNQNVKSIDKDIIEKAIDEAVLFTHEDKEYTKKFILNNSKNLKDFILPEENK